MDTMWVEEVQPHTHTHTIYTHIKGDLIECSINYTIIIIIIIIIIINADSYCWCLFTC